MKHKLKIETNRLLFSIDFYIGNIFYISLLKRYKFKLGRNKNQFLLLDSIDKKKE